MENLSPHRYVGNGLLSLVLLLASCWGVTSSDTSVSASHNADSLFVRVLVMGELAVDLMDPQGSVDTLRDAGPSNTIPRCERRTSLENGEAGGFHVATTFELKDPLPGTYHVRLRKSGIGNASIMVERVWRDEDGCYKGDTVELPNGARYVWAVRWDRPPKAHGECPIEIAGSNADGEGKKGHKQRQRRPRTQ